MKIGAHVFYYSIFFGVATGATYMFSQTYGPSEDELRKTVAKNFSSDQQQEESRKKMKVFFDKMRNHDSDQNEKMDAILKGGKDV